MSALSRRDAGRMMLAPVVSSLHAAPAERPWKVLLVVAHPDDEYYFAATAYRIAGELNGIVDQVVITNGEGGYKYSALAERIYGIPLTEESSGRSRLPEIRRRETLAAGRILGIRNHYFFDERDLRFTLSADEALSEIWHCDSVRTRLRQILERERYDFIFTVLPRESTHGHHQAATLLALEAAGQSEEARRPVVLGAEPARAHETELFAGLPGFAASRPAHLQPDFTFDRRQSFGYQDALDYEIVVRWVIAEHKSQGKFQNDAGRHDVERFWRFAAGPRDAAARTAELARQLRRSPSAAAPARNPHHALSA